MKRVLSLQRPARCPELGVEAGAEDQQILRILDEVTGTPSVAIDGEGGGDPLDLFVNLLGDRLLDPGLYLGLDGGGDPLLRRRLCKLGRDKLVDHGLWCPGRGGLDDGAGDLFRDRFGDRPSDRGSRLLGRRRCNRRRNCHDGIGSGCPHRLRRGQPGLVSRRRSVVRADDGEAAVVIDGVEAELGVVQTLGEVTQRYSPLAHVVRLAVRCAWYAQKLRIDHGLTTQTGEGRRRARAGALTALSGLFVVRDVGVDVRRQGTEALGLVEPIKTGVTGVVQKRSLPARADIVVRGEVGADRIDLCLLPPELVKAFQRQVGGRRHRQRSHRNRDQGVAQLRPRSPQIGHVERVDDVDPVLDERTLAPVEDMVAEPYVDQYIVTNVQCAVHVEIEDFEIPGRQILRLGGERERFPLAVLILEVDESVDAGEGAEIPGVELELGRHPGCVADETTAVVAVAVVGIDADQVVVTISDPEGHAMGERGVEAPPGLAFAELDRLHRHRVQEPAKGKGARHRGDRGVRRALGYGRRRCRTVLSQPQSVRLARPRRTGFQNIPHGVPLSWLGRLR